MTFDIRNFYTNTSIDHRTIANNKMLPEILGKEGCKAHKGLMDAQNKENSIHISRQWFFWS